MDTAPPLEVWPSYARSAGLIASLGYLGEAEAGKKLAAVEALCRCYAAGLERELGEAAMDALRLADMRLDLAKAGKINRALERMLIRRLRAGFTTKLVILRYNGVRIDGMQKPTLEAAKAAVSDSFRMDTKALQRAIRDTAPMIHFATAWSLLTDREAARGADPPSAFVLMHSPDLMDELLQIGSAVQRQFDEIPALKGLGEKLVRFGPRQGSIVAS